MSIRQKPRSKQMPLDYTERGRQFWLLDRILERLPEPPVDKAGKTYFSRATVNSVLRQLDQLAFRGGRITPNAIAAVCGFKVPKFGQHGNTRRILNWCESLGIVAIVRCSKGGNQALEPRLCFSQIDAIICGGEPFGPESSAKQLAGAPIVTTEGADSQKEADRCASNSRPLCGRRTTSY